MKPSSLRPQAPTPHNRLLLSLNAWLGRHPRAPWLLFLAGLVLYIGVQGAFTVGPLAGWDLFPEMDDGFTYVLKTRQMADCIRQDCPALNDLRQQLLPPAGAPEAARQRFLAASRIFPFYHPLFSVILLAFTKLGFSFLEAYRLIWVLGPFVFAAAFAALLSVLCGPAPAGLALGLLAFKVFPDTGLHHIVPSNLTMALAVLLWARLVARRGDAPYALSLGALVLVGFHPIGRIYTVMAACLAVWLSPAKTSLRLWLSVGAATLIVGLAFLAAALVKQPVMYNLMPPGDTSLLTILQGAAQSAQQVMVDIVRLEAGLLGSVPFFAAAIILGLLTLPPDRRRLVSKVVALKAFFLSALFFYVSSHPADLIFRLWIPLMVVLFGLVGQALWYALTRSWDWLVQHAQEDPGPLDPDAARPLFPSAWPLLLLALLSGYAINMVVRGGEQLAVTAQYIRHREPLTFSPAQVELLLSQSRPQDRVLYTSFIIMPYYFIHGAMQRGAVYYHPALQDDPAALAWLARPDLRFAVTYNPLVYHPAFAGMEEHLWWPTSPDFHFSPLNNPRQALPLAQEGKIPAADFYWLEVAPQTPNTPPLLRLWVDNPGPTSTLTLAPLDSQGQPDLNLRREQAVPGKWSGWLEFDLASWPSSHPLRLLFPAQRPPYFIKGLTFGRDRHLWPWSQRASLTLLPKKHHLESITVSFDLARLLPAPLRPRRAAVLDDHGSAVLLQMED